MDNVCHTLVGAALGEAGLKHRTRYGQATLMIAANLPDVDVLVFFSDISPVSFRRGWTHGVLAQVLLPFALTALVWAIERLRSARRGAAPPLRIGWLLVCACAGVVSHVLLDLLNNYGVRLLAPFDWRWFYGDAVFIVDPWLWLVLGAGIWLSRRQQRTRPARGALVFAVSYIVAMVVSASSARAVVADLWREARDVEPRALMVGPVLVSPFRRDVVIDAGDHYETGTFTWFPAGVTFDPKRVPKNAGRPEVAAARERSRQIREFLVWSRFPFWTVEDEGDEARVSVADMRFMAAGRRFSASTTISRPAAASD